MNIKFITPCPVYASGPHAGGAHACGPIEWGPAEIGMEVEAFLVQDDAYARGIGTFAPADETRPADEMWEIHTHPVQGTLVPGPAVGFGLARVTMRSKHHGDVVNTIPWCERLTLVPKESSEGRPGGGEGGGHGSHPHGG